MDIFSVIVILFILTILNIFPQLYPFKQSRENFRETLMEEDTLEETVPEINLERVRRVDIVNLNVLQKRCVLFLIEFLELSKSDGRWIILNKLLPVFGKRIKNNLSKVYSLSKEKCNPGEKGFYIFNLKKGSPLIVRYNG